jgi:ribosomal-protein-alanine N-acetyltransferase
MIQPPAPYRLRPLLVGDLTAVSVIEQDSFPTPTKKSAYEYELTQNQVAHYQALLMEPGSGPAQLVGYAGYWVLADEIHVSIIAVAPDLRGKGLGELLFLNMLYLSYEEQAALVTLEVRERNVSAQSLYSKYLFEVVGRRRRYYRDTGEDAILMTVMLHDSPIYPAFLDERRAALFQRLSTAPN